MNAKKYLEMKVAQKLCFVLSIMYRCWLCWCTEYARGRWYRIRTFISSQLQDHVQYNHIIRHTIWFEMKPSNSIVYGYMLMIFKSSYTGYGEYVACSDVSCTYMQVYCALSALLCGIQRNVTNYNCRIIVWYQTNIIILLYALNASINCQLNE